MAKNKDISLIVGLSIPVAMILFVAASIYLPQLWAPQPQTNFLYSLSTNYYPAKEYFVQNNKIAQPDMTQPEHIKNTSLPLGEVRLFLHDVVKNESREISFEKAQNLRLDERSVSPDGFETVPGSNSDFFFLFSFSNDDYSSMYLKGHSISKKLNLYKLSPRDNYGYGNIYRFIGWVIE